MRFARRPIALLIGLALASLIVALYAGRASTQAPADAAVLQYHKNPTREQIIHGMEQNLCRCGAHTRIIDAVQTAAAEMKGSR